MYDPDVAIGGHQPTGYDELMKQYEKYTVLKCHVTLENTSVLNYRSMMMCIVREQQPGDVAAQFATDGLPAILERDGVSKSLAVTTGEYSSDKRTVSMWFDMSKYTGKSYKDLIGDIQYQGDVGTDPSSIQRFAIMIWSPQNTDQSGNAVQFTVKIQYYAAFTKRMPTEGS